MIRGMKLLLVAFSLLAVIICSAALAGSAPAPAASGLPYGERQDLAIAEPGETLVYEITNGTGTASFYNLSVKNVSIPNDDYYASFVSAYVNTDNEIISSTAIKTDQHGVLSQRLEPGETCYLMFYMKDNRDKNATGSFQVTVDQTPDETGEAIAGAQPIAFSDRQELSITGIGDVDVFSITNDTDTAAFYNVTTKNVDIPNKDYYASFSIAFLNADNEVITSTAIKTEKYGTLSQRLEPGETCYLQFGMKSNDDKNATGSYQVTVLETPDETGEAIAGAQPIAFTDRQELSITGIGDVDVFSVTNDTDTAAFYNVTTKNVDIPNKDYYASFSIAFLNEDNEVVTSTAIKTGQYGTLSQRLEPGETCYLQFGMKSNDDKDAAGNYQVTVLEAPDETGETIAEAQPIALDEKLSLSITGIGDVDVFSVTNDTDTAAFYNVTTKNVDIPNKDYYASFSIAFLNEDNEVVTSAAIKTEQYGALSQRLEPGETCYLKFNMRDNEDRSAFGSYEATVSQAPDDAGETLDTAAPLPHGEKLTFGMDGHGDVDVFALEGARGIASYDVDIKNIGVESGGTAGTALNAVLLDGEGDAQESLYLATGEEGRFNVPLAPGEKAYVQVFMGKDRQDQMGAYTLTITPLAEESTSIASAANDITENTPVVPPTTEAVTATTGQTGKTDDGTAPGDEKTDDGTAPDGNESEQAPTADQQEKDSAPPVEKTEQLPTEETGKGDDTPALAGEREALYSGRYVARVDASLWSVTLTLADNLEVTIDLREDGNLYLDVLNFEQVASPVFSILWQGVPMEHRFRYTWEEEGSLMRIRDGSSGLNWFVDSVDFQVYANEKGTAVVSVMDIPFSIAGLSITPTFSVYGVRVGDLE